MGQVRKPERGRAAVRLRRILLLAAHPGEGRLTQPTAATQAWGREPLFMPHSSPFDRGGETGDPWPLLTQFQTGGLSNAKN